MSRPLKLFLYTVCLAAANHGSAAVTLLLTNAAQVRVLTQAEAAKRLPVKLRGVVMDEAGMSTGLIIHDGEQGIYIEGSRSQVSPFRRRDQVELEGVTDPGGFAPIVRLTKIHRTGKSDIPPPEPATFEQLLSGRLDAQWVEITGIIRTCEPLGQHTRLELATGGERLAVRTSRIYESGRFVDAEVRVRAICFNQHNVARQMVSPVLDIPPGEEIIVTQPARPDPFATPAQSVSQLLQFAPEGNYGHRAHLRGIVTRHRLGENLWLRDDAGGLRVQTRQDIVLHPGDIVDVVGFPNRSQYSPVLEDALLRRIGTTNPPAPIILTNFAAVPDCNNNLVQIDARFVEFRQDSLGWTVALDWNDTTIHAVLRHPAEPKPPAHWQSESRVRITGICSITTPNDQVPMSGLFKPRSFELLMRSTDDLQLLQPPPWWTPQRMAWLLSVIVLALVGLLAAIILSARHNLRQQAARRTMAEAEFAAILTERNRMAREIHDTLAQGLVATSMQLELAKSEVESDQRKSLAQHLEAAHKLVRDSLQEARNSIWNMRSQVLETGDLGSALEGILKQLADGTNVVATMEITGNRRRLPPQTENNLLRVGQEAITNATKHARASHITAALHFSEREIRLTVQDDGHGFDSAKPPPGEGGFGLVGMKERAMHLRGRVEVTSAPGRGTKIELTVPLSG